MPTFMHDVVLACICDQAYEYLCVPGHRLELAPPDWPLELVDGPPRLELGARTTWKLRRFGISQSWVLEVTECIPPTRLVEEQRQGPFRRWVHAVTCTPHPDGMVLHDAIDYESPGGMLGLLVTAATIDTMLTPTFAWRDQQLRNRLEAQAHRE